MCRTLPGNVADRLLPSMVTELAERQRDLYAQFSR